MESPGDRSEIAFFDVETTVPTRPGQGFAILEFGAILVCPRKLVELEIYSTLVRPFDLSLISAKSVRCNGIDRDSVSSAPSFAEIADKVHGLLHGRIWAGHNILRFDCLRIKEAFEGIGRHPPEPKGTIDSLALLTQKFGRRAGNMKMATLASYFGLGQQTHRSLDDVRMNLEVLKYCATVLFLESSLPEILTCENPAFSSSQMRLRGARNGEVSPAETNLFPAAFHQLEKQAVPSLTNQVLGDRILSFVESNLPYAESFNMSRLAEQIQSNSLEEVVTMDEQYVLESAETSVPAAAMGCGRSSAFVALDDVSIPAISASLVPFYRPRQRIQILHNNIILKLQCSHLKVRFGLSTKFVDHAGRPRLSFVVEAISILCKVLDKCDEHAQRLFLESGSTSDWRPVVTRKNGYLKFPTVRLHIPTLVTGDVAQYATEIWQKEAASGAEQKLAFSRFDAAELSPLFTPGEYVDAFISLDPYDYQQNAGIRLVAEKLVIHQT